MVPNLKPSEQFCRFNTILSRRTRHFSQREGTLNDGFSTASRQRKTDAALVEQTKDISNLCSLFESSEENLAETSALERTADGVEGKPYQMHTTQSNSSLGSWDGVNGGSGGSTAASSEDPFDDCNALSSHSSPISSSRGIPLPASPALEDDDAVCSARDIALAASPPSRFSPGSSPREIALPPSPSSEEVEGGICDPARYVLQKRSDTPEPSLHHSRVCSLPRVFSPPSTPSTSDVPVLLCGPQNIPLPASLQKEGEEE